MANWSNTNITFTSKNKKSLEALSLFVQTNTFKYFLEECKFITDDGHCINEKILCFHGESRWGFDGNSLDDLLPILKKLDISLEVIDSEPGDNYVCRWQSDDYYLLFFYEEDQYTSQLYIDIYGISDFIDDKSYIFEYSNSIEELLKDYKDEYDLLISNKIMTHEEIENEFKKT